jgi:hypothetical protein
LLSALRQGAGLLDGLGQDAKARLEEVFGADGPGFWLGHAFYKGITPSMLKNRTLFPCDVYEAMTTKVATWYRGRRVKVSAIRAPSEFRAPIVWTKDPDEQTVALLAAACAGVRTLGQKSNDGLGLVEIKLQGAADYMARLGG